MIFREFIAFGPVFLKVRKFFLNSDKSFDCVILRI